MSPDPILSSRVGWVAVAGGVLEASGPDAVRFVDNFTTAALGNLVVGGGTEGFFTDARGWVLALTTILRTEAGLVILTDTPAAAATLRDHLEHYHIRERLELRDISAAHDALVVAGSGAADAVASLCRQPPPIAAASHASWQFDGGEGRVIRLAGQGADGYRLLVAAGRGDDVAALASAAGVPRGEPTSLEALRIEAGYPAAGDIPPRTLPQELGRDTRAISFTKGCYLGQETVARLDALGHVNRRLIAFAIDATDPPTVPAAILQGGTEVGTITSAAASPTTGGAIGLGLVQVKALAAGGLEVGGVPVRPLGREGDA